MSVKRFCFLSNRVLNHENEVQLFMRVRPHPRLEAADMFIEPGCAGRCNASYEEQLQAVLQDESCPLLASAWADVKAAESDSTNRHLW